MHGITEPGRLLMHNHTTESRMYYDLAKQPITVITILNYLKIDIR